MSQRKIQFPYRRAGTARSKLTADFSQPVQAPVKHPFNPANSQQQNNMNAISTIIIITAVALTGCASTRASSPADPLEPINRITYKFNDTVDKAVIKPVARGYKAVMPTVGRIMVSNFFSNLDDVVVTANDLLQFKLVYTSDA